MGFSIMVSNRLCAIANTAWLSKWMLTNTTSIVYMAFLYIILLTEHFCDIAICALNGDR